MNTLASVQLCSSYDGRVDNGAAEANWRSICRTINGCFVGVAMQRFAPRPRSAMGCGFNGSTQHRPQISLLVSDIARSF